MRAIKNSPLSKEIFGVLLFALGLIVLLSLISYDAIDNGIKISNDEEFRNWLGPMGAIISESLVSFLGIWAFCFPLGLFYLSTRAIFSLRGIFTLSRLFGLALFVFGLAPLLSHLFDKNEKNTFLVSGMVGVLQKNFLLTYISSSGLWIIALTCMLAATLLAIGKPFLFESFSKLGMSVLWAFSQSRKKMPKKVEKKLEETPKDNGAESALEKNESDPVAVVDEKNFQENLESESDIQIIERDRKESVNALKQADKEGSKKDYSYTMPPLKLLDYDAPNSTPLDQAQLKAQADRLSQAFLQFGIEGKIREIRPGPVVTNYEFVPSPGIKLSKISALSDDIAMAMSAVHVRIVTPIPGKGAVGIEVPNDTRETVFLKEIVADKNYRAVEKKLCMAVGKDVEGNPFFMNLDDMPHVLISGTTGSGKSVSVNGMICSILYRASPDDVKFLMIDPKMLELSIYKGIPHLLLPPIIDAKKAANALRWTVKEMDSRYELMKEAQVRDINTYNKRIRKGELKDAKEITGRKHGHMPFIVVVIDEYADLLAVAGKEVEGLVMRLAQKARASGIHVMLATQRPSVDVITGVIKANFPVRMGFRLASAHDSKTIVNKTGAEKLLGRGDCLIMPPGTSDLYRIHGAFISEKELNRVVEFWSKQKSPEYNEDIVNCEENNDAENGASDSNKKPIDEKYDEAIAVVKEYKKCSTSFIQRQLSVGYNRAARIVEQMEQQGAVGPVLNAKGEREIFVD